MDLNFRQLSAGFPAAVGNGGGKRAARGFRSGRWWLHLLGLALVIPVWLGPVQAGSLQWEKVEGGRLARFPVAPSGKTGFTRLPPERTGIQLTNALPNERAMANINLMNGSGVALGDFDGDGLCDIYLCRLNGRNALYRNMGDWKFADVTEEAGVACPNQTSTGAVFCDLNGDGHLDLLVSSMGGPNACFLNDGHGHFRNVTGPAGLLSKLGSTSMALADVDRNGTLDLYVANYGVTSILRTGGAVSFTYIDGKPVVRGRYAQRVRVSDGVMDQLGEPDVLALNDGKGKFTPVNWTDGTFLDETGKPLTQAPWDQGLTVLFRDLNGDGFPDLYVCNDEFTPDRCWINDGHGHFRALNHLALRATSYFSMGADVADIDRDGHDDLLVVDMLSRQHPLALTQKSGMHPQPRLPGDLDTQFQLRRNTLFLNRGDGTFAEIANYSGVAASEWSWSCIFLDVDLDGWEDILISNGFPRNMDDLDTKEKIKQAGTLSPEAARQALFSYPPLNTPNVAFRNQHDLTFAETGKEWGFDSTQVSNGMALADLDNDGDLDVVVNCLNGPVLIYRNDTAAPRLAVRLRGQPPNTQGIGARITVSGGPVTQSQQVICGGRYVSGDDPMRVFAAGTATNLTIAVTWPGGARSVLTGCQPNALYEVDEAVAQGAAATAIESGTSGSQKPVSQGQRSPEAKLWFEDVSALLNHSHHEELFDDFARQPLLPNRLSQLGPGVGWFDFDGDGRDDLVVASGKGGRLAIYHNDAKSGFQAVQSPALNTPATRDQTTVLGWSPSPGATSLLVGSANYEDGTTNGEAVLRLDLSNGIFKSAPGLPAQTASAGPLALADMDGTGHLNLFVGGRVIPGRYPEAASSHLYQYQQERWQLDGPNSEVLRNVGLVCGAVWSDLDGDGLPELILACEWGPLRVFKNQAGQLREATAELGLAQLTGWWTGVAAGDFDGDGRMDLIAGNWGLNSPYHANREHPARLYFGDLADRGAVDLIEADQDPELGIVPRRDFGAVSAALPFLRGRFASHWAFAKATVAEVLGAKASQVRQASATTLSSMLFLNRGDHFEPVVLPREAQFAPVFGVCIGDLDGDGHEDVFLSQNFMATQPDMPGLNAGRGLWLRGDGTGKLTPVPGQESGVRVYGDQRGAALSDFDQDGRVDLVVSQNGAATKLFRNVGAKPGLRVRLKGPPGNPNGLGAVIRLRTGHGLGPAREIHGGSGYWSQDSAVQVLGTPEPATEIWIRWPGGQTTRSPIPAGAAEIGVGLDGHLERVR